MDPNEKNDVVDEQSEDTFGTPGEYCGEEIEVKTTLQDEEKDYVPEESVRLPVGILKNGTRHRNVLLEEMSGIDEHLLSSKEARKNGAVSSTLVICRTVQEVEGLLERKTNPEKQFDRSLGRAMVQPDRDFLLSRIQLLGGNNHVTMAGECPRCKRVWEEEALLSSMPVIEWPEDKPTLLDFTLEKGVKYTDDDGNDAVGKKGKLRFPVGKDQEMAGELNTVAEQMDSLFAACIVNLEGIGRLDQETVKRLKSRDRRYLMDVVQRNLPGLRQWKDVDCICGKEFTISADLTSFFDGRRKKLKK